MNHPCTATFQDFASAPFGTSAVCADCFADPALREWIRNNDSASRCDFCHSPGAAASLASVSLRIMNCVCLEYGSEQQSEFVDYRRAAYASAQSWGTEELLFGEIGLQLPNDRAGKLRAALLKQIGGWRWREVEWNPYEAEGCAILRHTWEQFCRVVRHEKRFFFVPGADEDPQSQFAYVNVREVLDRLLALVWREGLFRRLPPGSLLYRAELEDGLAEPLGPADFAFPLNPVPRRHEILNPPGIPALYGAESIAALRQACAKAGTYAIAAYSVTAELSVADLTALPAVPSLFAREHPRWFERRILLLAHQAGSAMAKPLPEATAIDYLPTQVVSEYFRVAGGRGVQGIRYPGSGGEPLLVLFEESNSSAAEQRAPLHSLLLQGVQHEHWAPAAAGS